MRLQRFPHGIRAIVRHATRAQKVAARLLGSHDARRAEEGWATLTTDPSSSSGRVFSFDALSP
jgi:hypothetical protein